MAASGGRAKVFWFRKKSNFGDTLAPLLVERFAGLEATWSRPESSEAVVIGSIAGRLPRGYRGVVVGIGKIDEDSRIDLSSAHVLGLRGALTLRGAGIRNDVVLGDSGLLIADLLGDREAPSHPLGVVAHYADSKLNQRYPDAFQVDVTQEPLEVVRQIASCERIVSSSLHGLVTADSLGIPRFWAPSDELMGGRFKFADYASALGVSLEPETWASAPRAAVEAIVARLRDAYRAMPGAIAALPAPSARQRLWQLRARFGRV